MRRCYGCFAARIAADDAPALRLRNTSRSIRSYFASTSRSTSLLRRSYFGSTSLATPLARHVRAGMHLGCLSDGSEVIPRWFRWRHNFHANQSSSPIGLTLFETYEIVRFRTCLAMLFLVGPCCTLLSRVKARTPQTDSGWLKPDCITDAQGGHKRRARNQTTETACAGSCCCYSFCLRLAPPTERGLKKCRPAQAALISTSLYA
ncbi:hypothetical protein P3T25_009666 [Paraburkholderia sp. GAS32]